MENPKRGEIWLVDLNPTKGSEQAGTRPFLIIQRDTLNQYSPVTIGFCITSKVNKIGPHHVLIRSQMSGLRKDSIILTNQIRTIDKTRLKNKLGRIDSPLLKQVERALLITCGVGE